MPSFYTDLGSRLRRPVFRAINHLKYLAVRARTSLNGAIRHVHGPRHVDCARDEVVLLCLVKDGELWIESFVRHHLDLGVKHIFFLDNGSTDSTVERARQHDHVSVWLTDLPFRTYEQGMRRWLTRTFGRHRWSLTCDVDELFDYPHSDRLDFRGFLQYLNHHSYRAVAAQMLDMFSEQPFSELTSRPEDRLREKYRFYDLSAVSRRRDLYWIESGDVENQEITAMMGGVREEVFGSVGLLQTKHPLVFADHDVNIYPYDVHFHTRASVADVSAVLFHYKFLSTLRDQAREALELAQHSGGSRHYRGFYRVLSEKPNLSLYTDTSAELRETSQLIDQRFLVVSENYEEWIEAHGSERSAEQRD